MNAIFATIIFRMPTQGYQGNNFMLGEVATQFDGETINVESIDFRTKGGEVKISVEVETSYSDTVECADEDAAESIIQDKLDRMTFDAKTCILIRAQDTQFTS